MVENFFLEFQLARYVQRCQYIKRTLCKKLKIFNNFFDLPSQLFILQHYATLERYSLLAYIPYRYGSYLKTQLMQSNALIITVSLDFEVTNSYKLK